MPPDDLNPNPAPAADPAAPAAPIAPAVVALADPAAPPNPAADPAAPPAADPIADWRKTIAGSDEKVSKLLERYSTPADFTKAHLEAVAKIRSGELLKPLAKDATPEQVKEYREALGIPEKPEGYFEKLPNGLVIGEEDKPLFDGFAAALHELHAPPAMIHKAVEWYYGMQDQQIQAQQEADSQAKPALEAKLRETWGADFKANANIYQSFIASAPEAVREALTTARDVNGNYILYSPEVVSWLTSQAREINPAGHIVPGGGDSSLNTIASEIKSIEDLMRTNRAEYNRDAAKQERYRQLIDARMKLEQRGKAA